MEFINRILLTEQRDDVRFEENGSFQSLYKIFNVYLTEVFTLNVLRRQLAYMRKRVEEPQLTSTYRGQLLTDIDKHLKLIDEQRVVVAKMAAEIVKNQYLIDRCNGRPTHVIENTLAEV